MQIKLTWYYNNARGRPRKKKIISRNRAYHGVTVATASLTGLPWVHDHCLPRRFTQSLSGWNGPCHIESQKEDYGKCRRRKMDQR